MNGRLSKRVSNGKRWSTREDVIINALYPDYPKILHRLKSRSYCAVKSRARTLGIVQSRHVWTAREESRLRNLYRRGASRTEVAHAFPYLTLCQIVSKAQHLNLIRARNECYVLGVPPIDFVREKAWSSGMTWRELDELADTGRYFQQTTRRVNWTYLAKAIEKLGGAIEVTWPSDNIS